MSLIGSSIILPITDNLVAAPLSCLGAPIGLICMAGGAQMITDCKKASKNADWNRKMQLAEEEDSKRRSEFAQKQHQGEVTLNNNL